MKIDEAVKRNENIQLEFLPLPRHRDWEALQLGLSALKRIEYLRSRGWEVTQELLPGETKD